jgi:hypothetical protein
MEHDVSWSSQIEDLVALEGERCLGLAKLHKRCEDLASSKNNVIQIPVIVLSTLCGTASVGSSALFGGSAFAPTIIGLVSIGVGILNTVGSYFGYAKKSEAHRIAHLQYSKLFSQLNVELSLPRSERASAEAVLKNLRDTMERLAEVTPSIPDEIIVEFNKKYESYKDIGLPIEANGLSKIKIFRSELKLQTPKIDSSTQSEV